MLLAMEDAPSLKMFFLFLLPPPLSFVAVRLYYICVVSMHRLPLRCCISLSVFTSVALQSLQTIAAFVPLLLSYSCASSSPHSKSLSSSISFLCLAHFPPASIVIHCICYTLWCSGFQFWALRPAALPISIPAF